MAGVIKRLEIWDSGEYGKYLEPRAGNVVAVVEQQLGDIGM